MSATTDPLLVAAAIPYAIAVAWIGAEVAWLARDPGPTRRRVLRSAGTASVMAAVALVVGTLHSALLHAGWDALAALRIEPLARLWHAHPVLGAAAAFVAWDLAGWLYHLIGHRTRLGWAAHQPHHSGSDYDATLGLRQTWVPFAGLAVQPLLALAGFEWRVIVVCAAVSNGWQVLAHTSLPVRLPGAVAAVVTTPATHRHHHGRDGGDVNLGPVLTVWDRLAGTWVGPDHPAPVAYGPSAPSSSNPLTVELAGWRELWSRAAATGSRQSFQKRCSRNGSPTAW